MDEAGQEISTTILPEEEKKLGFDDFKEALKENPNLPVSYQTLLPYVNDPEFFERFLSITGKSKVAKFKSELYSVEGGLLNLIQEKKEIFSEYLHSRFPTLDGITASQIGSLIKALGTKTRSRKKMATFFISEGFYNQEIPYGHADFKPPRRSFYFEPIVMGRSDVEKGKEIVMKNLGRFAQYEFKNPDKISESSHTHMFAQSLGISSTHRAIATACIKYNFFSPEIPDLHPISIVGRGPSFYFDEEVVGGGDIEKGRRIVEENKKRAVHYLFSSAKDVSKRFRSWRGLCTIFNVPVKITMLRRAIADIFTLC